MVEFMTNPSDNDLDGCLVALRVRVNKEGALQPEELNDIDNEMLSIGPNRTGQRIDVTSTKIKFTASVLYVYQETLHSDSINTAQERLRTLTKFDDASIFIGTEVVELKRT